MSDELWVMSYELRGSFLWLDTFGYGLILLRVFLVEGFSSFSKRQTTRNKNN